MHIKITLKTLTELTQEFPGWNGSQHGRYSDCWNLRRVSSFCGQDITHKIPKLYTKIKDVPKHVVLSGYQINKKYLRLEKQEKQDLVYITNGLHRIYHGKI